jgi:hypothetical protein
MKWYSVVPGTHELDVEHVAAHIIDVFHDGFGLPWRKDGWSVAQAAAMIERCTVVQVLIDGVWPADRIEGYACYVCPPLEIASRGHLLWEDAVCVRKPYQFLGFSRAALDNGLAAVGAAGRTVQWVGGRTQNPAVMLRYSRWGALYPLDRAYATEPGASVMAFLIENIREVGELDAVGRLDRGTGVIHCAYTEGKLGDYEIRIDPRVAKWETWLVANGFDRNRGDAVAIVAERLVIG